MIVKVNGVLRDEWVLSNTSLLVMKSSFTFDELFDECIKVKLSFSSKYLEEVVKDYYDDDLIYKSNGRYHFVGGGK